ncbi:MAG: TlpA family protein disulfide reductase [Candidatus Symbiothrix sp.]|jgi:thiol-disulfide isomerase/thioredoxin|nr:TlpA family protein disulfide reductase [Candidatus Symbiothrix sp.]
MRKIILILAVLSTLICKAGDSRTAAVVSCQWDSKNIPDKLYLYNVSNGDMIEVAASSADADKTFNFACQVPSADFYFIGLSTNPARFFAVYLKPSDRLDLAVNDSTFVLRGNANSLENQDMEQWNEFIREAARRANSQTSPISTYVDFFPLIEEKAQELLHYPTLHSRDGQFNRAFAEYRKLSLTSTALNHLFQLRTVHPKQEDFTPYYRNMRLEDITKTTDLLHFPHGLELIGKMIFSRSWIDGTQISSLESTLNSLPHVLNDTVKGEYVLNMASRQKTYDGMQAFENKYGSYIFTDAQKTAFQAMKTDLIKVEEGAPAIDFTVEDTNGKAVKLSDLKGKVVYIDFWATWCGPCIKEIPSLKQLESEYHNKNIAFVSISIDAEKDRPKWKNYVSSHGLQGLQWYAPEAAHKEISAAYQIHSIPRFILIDKNGKVVMSDAPRPSSSEIRPLIDRMLN